MKPRSTKRASRAFGSRPSGPGPAGRASCRGFASLGTSFDLLAGLREPVRSGYNTGLPRLSTHREPRRVFRRGPSSAIIGRMSERTGASRFAVVLVRPDSPENIGLAARGMANAGVADLRFVGVDRLEPPAWRTAIHAEAILEGARFFAIAGRSGRGPPPGPGLDGPGPPRLPPGLPLRGGRTRRRVSGRDPRRARLRQREDGLDPGGARPDQRPLPHPPGGPPAVLQSRRRGDPDAPRPRLRGRRAPGRAPGAAALARRTGRGRAPLPRHARQLRLHARHQPGLHHRKDAGHLLPHGPDGQGPGRHPGHVPQGPRRPPGAPAPRDRRKKEKP